MPPRVAPWGSQPPWGAAWRCITGGDQVPFPNRDTQFQPGQSGNPAGRPKSRTMTERLRAALEDVGDDGLDMGDTVIRHWLGMIADGSVGALVELMGRMDGPLTQNHKLEHDGGLTIRVEYADSHSEVVAPSSGPSDDPARYDTVPCAVHGPALRQDDVRPAPTDQAVLDGFPVAWFAPSYKYLTEAWREFERALKPVVVRKNATEHRIELVTGGSIDFWSLKDEDAGRSRKYKRVVVDEAAQVKNLEECWNGAIRPTLTDLKGDADLLSTPRAQLFLEGVHLGPRPP